MKQVVISITALLLIGTKSIGQTFISKASIEYEVKTNIKKTMGTGMWADMMKDKMPDFKTGYYTYTFADNKSVYKFTRWDEATSKMPEFLRTNDDENTWYFDFNANKFLMQKNVYGTKFNVEDSIPKINWKLSNENRMIAGFNCRKAVGVIMDSVYVFAFYTDEILIPGGPCSLNGLPGTILGLTIPRLYTSWIATKLMVNDVNVETIKPSTAKKYFTNKELATLLVERSKDWGDSEDADSKQWIEQFKWNALL